MENTQQKTYIGILKEKIEEKREQLLKNGDKYGLTHEKTLTDSRELDNLINKALRLKD